MSTSPEELEKVYLKYKKLIDNGYSNKDALNRLKLPYKGDERPYIKTRVYNDKWNELEPLYTSIEVRYREGEGLVKILAEHDIKPGSLEYNIIRDKLEKYKIKKPSVKKNDEGTIDDEKEILYQDYKTLFLKTTYSIKKIYEKIGVNQQYGSSIVKYIKRRSKEDGLNITVRRSLLKENKPKRNYKTSKDKNVHTVESNKKMVDSKSTLDKFYAERNVKKTTQKGYVAALLHWFDYNKDKYNNLQECIDTYLREEDDKIPMRERNFKKELLGFREYLLNESNIKSDKSIKSYFSKITSFFRHFSVEIPQLPQWKLSKGYVSSFNDLPTHDMIRSACEQSPLSLKALILFMSSSGSAKAETLSITVGMFLEGCMDYLDEPVNKNNMDDALKKLKDRHDIVPLIYLRRVKTDKWYHTCCSPEASYLIIEYLNTINFLDWTDKLFPYTSSNVIEKFQRINDNNNWGHVGAYRRFRSHALRKFMASNIGLGRDQVDSLQGRSKDEIQEAYFKQDPRTLKKIYMDNMHRVMIYNNWGYGVNAEELEQKNNHKYNDFNDADAKIIDISKEPVPNNEIISSIGLDDDNTTLVSKDMGTGKVYNPEVMDTSFPTENFNNNPSNMMGNVNTQIMGYSDFSVAKELLMYSELMEKGLLSVGEFNQVKSKLLGKVLR